MQQACEVIVDIAHANVDRLFTYLLPEGLTLPAGSHVLVPFGSGNRPREGFVIRVFEYNAADAVQSAEQTAVTLKTVLRTLEPYPILTEEQIELAYWMQKSYHCLLVDALRLMIPSQMRGGKIREKIERTVQLYSLDQADAMLASLLDKSGKPRSPKQYEVLELLAKAKTEFSVSDIAAYIPGASGAIGRADQARLSRGRRPRHPFAGPDLSSLSPDKHVTLSQSQLQAVEAIASAQTAREGTLLLHGVTGSGKTEVYMHAIERCLALGRQAIMLVPEISLTPADRRSLSGAVRGRNRGSPQQAFRGRAVRRMAANPARAKRASRSAQEARCSRQWRTSASSSWTKSTNPATSAR